MPRSPLSHRLRHALLAAGLVAAVSPVAGVGAAQAQPLEIGLSDQHATPFHDARLLRLPIAHARLTVPWDAMRHRYQVNEVDTWMRATRAAGIAPLVTFAKVRTRTTGALPSVADYARLTRRFRLRYPHVQQYSPWNEPNVAYRRRANDSARIAAYYRVLRRTCPTCTVLGVDAVDSSTFDDWLKAYLRQFPGPKPKHWGLHNYVDANTTSSWGTRTMLRLVPGEVWFTETGGIYRRGPGNSIPRDDRRHAMRIGPARAPKAIRRVFALARLSPRIARVYLYHWKSDPRSTWDSALLAPGGTARPGFQTFAAELKAAASARPAP